MIDNEYEMKYKISITKWKKRKCFVRTKFTVDSVAPRISAEEDEKRIEKREGKSSRKSIP